MRRGSLCNDITTVIISYLPLLKFAEQIKRDRFRLSRLSAKGNLACIFAFDKKYHFLTAIYGLLNWICITQQICKNGETCFGDDICCQVNRSRTKQSTKIMGLSSYIFCLSLRWKQERFSPIQSSFEYSWSSFAVRFYRVLVASVFLVTFALDSFAAFFVSEQTRFT